MPAALADAGSLRMRASGGVAKRHPLSSFVKPKRIIKTFVNKSLSARDTQRNSANITMHPKYRGMNPVCFLVSLSNLSRKLDWIAWDISQYHYTCVASFAEARGFNCKNV